MPTSLTIHPRSILVLNQPTWLEAGAVLQCDQDLVPLLYRAGRALMGLTGAETIIAVERSQITYPDLDGGEQGEWLAEARTTAALLADEVSHQKRLTSTQRIERAVRQIAAGRQSFLLSISKAQLAALAGCTPENLSRLLPELESRGIRVGKFVEID